MYLQLATGTGIAPFRSFLWKMFLEEHEDYKVCACVQSAIYVCGKEKEWDEYRTHVSSWELEKYLITY